MTNKSPLCTVKGLHLLCQKLRRNYIFIRITVVIQILLLGIIEAICYSSNFLH